MLPVLLLAQTCSASLDSVHTWATADTIANLVASSVKLLPLPPQELIDAIGGGDGHTVGGLNLRYLLALTGLQEDSKVLEIGCGFGRNARWLSRYLNASGDYDGFDIVPKLIGWGKSNICHGRRNFRLHLAQVLNKHYTSWLRVRYANDGKPADAATYRFPFETGAKDIVFNPSVFTHLLRPALENYVRETFRVLRPGGVALYWLFLLDHRAKDALSQHASAFAPGLRASYHDDVSWALRQAPEAMIVYDVSYLKNMLHNAGFVSIKILFGSWRAPTGSGLPTAPRAGWTDASPDFQDLVYCEKPPG